MIGRLSVKIKFSQEIFFVNLITSSHQQKEKCDLFDKFSNSQKEGIKHLVSNACRAMMSDDYR